MPVKMAQFNMPLHLQTPESEYIMEDHYHDNGMTSPHELGPWQDDPADGGGKFRLKRRRRCGQCGPCQVKDNCNKCQYCLRKDVLKQACIYRKCVYLRKPVPRFRTEMAGMSSSCSGGGGVWSGGGGMVGGGVVNGGSNSNSCANKTSPQKSPSTPSSLANTTSSQPTPSPCNPSSGVAAAAAQSAEMNSCQLAQNPFGPSVNNGVVDPLRASALEQHHSALLDASRTPYLSGRRSLDSGRSPALDLGRNTNTADSGFGTGSSMTTSPANSITKDRPSIPPVPPVTPREQYRSPMDQWGAMPYGFPRANPWAHTAFQANPAAAYGFQPSMTHYTNPFASSCRLGMQEPASHLATPSQPSFHCNMPYARPDFSAHTNFRATAPSMPSAMTPPFYPPPPHIPSSLPNFPSFNQLPSSAGPHATYPMAHPPMYPGNFYSSFRPPTEPQIYHALLPPPYSPFSQQGQFPSAFPTLSQKRWTLDKDGDSEKDEESLKKKFSIFCVPSSKLVCDRNTSDSIHIDLSKTAAEDQMMLKDMTDSASDTHKDHDLVSLPLQTTTECGIDEDLQQHMRRISGMGACDMISIDDFKMHAFIRSDGFNNLEIEIDSPALEAAFRKARCLQRCEKECEPAVGDRSVELQYSVGNTICENGWEGGSCCGSTSLSQRLNTAFDTDSDSVVVEQSKSSQQSSALFSTQTDIVSVKQDAQLWLQGETAADAERVKTDNTTVTDLLGSKACGGGDENKGRILWGDVTVCLMQEGEGGVIEVEVPGTQVRLEEVDIDDNLLSTSSNPPDLLRFMAEGEPVPASPDIVFQFQFDNEAVEAVDDFASEDLSDYRDYCSSRKTHQHVSL